MNADPVHSKFSPSSGMQIPASTNPWAFLYQKGKQNKTKQNKTKNKKKTKKNRQNLSRSGLSPIATPNQEKLFFFLMRGPNGLIDKWFNSHKCCPLWPPLELSPLTLALARKNKLEILNNQEPTYVEIFWMCGVPYKSFVFPEFSALILDTLQWRQWEFLPDLVMVVIKGPWVICFSIGSMVDFEVSAVWA